MKLTTFLLLGAAVTRLVHGQDDEEIEIENEQDVNTPNIAQFNISYSIAEAPDFSRSQFVEFDNGASATLNFDFENREDANITIVSLGGSILDAHDYRLVANLTERYIGPIDIAINQTAKFQEIVKFDMIEGDYFMTPSLYVLKGAEVLKVGTTPSLIRINPPPMSFFDPKFLLVQFVLLSILGVSSYYMFTSSVGRTSKPSKKTVISAKVDASWLPDTHKR